MGHVVDVLARAGEVHELTTLLEGSALDFLLDEVLNRLDIVVRRLFDVLHALGIRHGELVRNLLEQNRLFRRQRRTLRQFGIRAECGQPSTFHRDATLHKAIFREDAAKLLHLGPITPIQRRNRAQHVKCSHFSDSP